jgi:hypothetical protein
MTSDVSFIQSNNDLEDSFVGFKIINNKAFFYYPYFYVMPNNQQDRLTEARKILRSLFLTKKTSENSSLFKQKGAFTNNSFESFYFLVDHYYKYKKYENNEKKFSINTGGKVEWKKTLKKQPFITENGYIFNEIVYSKSKNVDNILSEAYTFAVSKSIDNIGWIFGINNSLIIKFPRKNLYLSALSKELNNTFNDSKRRLLRHIKNAISGIGDQMENSNFVYGVNSFEYVYESMINYIFSNVKNIQDYYPSAKWVVGSKDIKTRNLRPDTIIENENEIIIIDSKYYGLDNEKARRLPQSSDIQKQLTYEEFVKNYLSKNKRIHNLFLLPKNRISEDNINLNKEIGSFISYFGYAVSNWKGQKAKVHGLLIDLNKLVDDFLNNERSLNVNLNQCINSITSD